MSGHHKFSELAKYFTPEDRKIVEAEKSKMRAEMGVEPSSTSEDGATQRVVAMGKVGRLRDSLS